MQRVSPTDPDAKGSGASDAVQFARFKVGIVPKADHFLVI